VRPCLEGPGEVGRGEFRSAGGASRPSSTIETTGFAWSNAAPEPCFKLTGSTLLGERTGGDAAHPSSRWRRSALFDIVPVAGASTGAICATLAEETASN